MYKLQSRRVAFRSDTYFDQSNCSYETYLEHPNFDLNKWRKNDN